MCLSYTNVSLSPRLFLALSEKQWEEYLRVSINNNKKMFCKVKNYVLRTGT